MRVYLIGATVAAMAVLGMGAAGAAQPAPVASTIAFASPAGATAQPAPALGQSVAFATTYPNTTKNPSIEVDCYQNGVLVWGRVGAVSDGYLLGGAWSPWVDNGGSAQCVAMLEDIVWVHKMEQINRLASMPFAANAA